MTHTAKLVLAVVTLATSSAHADGEPVILIANQPGGKLALQPLQKGAARDVPDGATGVRDYDAHAPEGSAAVKIDNVLYAVKLANVCAASGEPRADGARFIACNESSGDFPHAGDLNTGIEPTKWPAPVTFGKTGKPQWK